MLWRQSVVGITLKCLRGLVLVLAISLLAACSTSRTANIEDSNTKPPDPKVALFNPDAKRLEQIRAGRASDPALTLGPGDILEISAPDIEELAYRDVRVTEAGTVQLPVVGTLEAGGLTEARFTETLRERLSKYVKDPELHVFVKEYFNRDVAVGGWVSKPGLYEITSPSDTLLDMLNRAGGITTEHATAIIFVPALPGRPLADRGRLEAEIRRLPREDSTKSDKDPSQLFSDNPERATGQPVPRVRPIKASVSPALTSGVTKLPDGENSILIPLSETEWEKALQIPARPGDALFVPGGGTVMVQGWVRTPGAYPISSGMTAVAAISAAGGGMFSSSATVLRAMPQGSKVKVDLDVRAIRKGLAEDVAVQSGDVIIVNRSVPGSVPYFLYTVFNRFGTGMYISPPLL